MRLGAKLHLRRSSRAPGGSRNRQSPSPAARVDIGSGTQGEGVTADLRLRPRARGGMPGWRKWHKGFGEFQGT